MQVSLQSLEPLITRAGVNRRSFVLFVAACLACILPALAEDSPAKQTVYKFSLVDLDGKTVPLSNYKGKLLLIVNLASQSIYHDQIAALNELQKSYADQGLVVIGIPSSDFGGEELKDTAALRKFYIDTVHTTFPVFASAVLHGVNTIPLYQFLCDGKQSLPGGEIHWNFTKFLIDREGKPLARYEVTRILPTSISTSQSKPRLPASSRSQVRTASLNPAAIAETTKTNSRNVRAAQFLSPAARQNSSILPSA